MRMSLAITFALLLSVTALAEDVKADDPVPMKDGDKVEAICYERSSSGFKLTPVEAAKADDFMGVVAPKLTTVRWVPFYSTKTEKELLQTTKFKVSITNKKVAVHMIFFDGTTSAAMPCKRHKRQFTRTNDFHVDCESTTGDLQFNLETRKMTSIEIEGFQDLSATYISSMSKGYISIGTCDILSGAKHLRKHEVTELMK